MKVSLVKPDRRHIDLSDAATAHRWTKKFGVTREALAPPWNGSATISKVSNASWAPSDVAKKKKKKRALKRDAVSPFRDKLWKLFQEHASGMDGADVVVALKQAGEEIWAVGMTIPIATCGTKTTSPSATPSTSPGSPSSALSSRK